MEKYSIKNLLKGTVILDQIDPSKTLDLSGIEIPIIQRDYAQGRTSETRVRNRFLKAIFKALKEGDELELDFVYGSIKTIKRDNNEINVFLPLDGQQRLTTIFLLHWFIANKELDEDKLKIERELFSNFSYSTRSTARMFCEKLSMIGYEKNPVEEIKSSYWYHKSFEMDPTVKGMLTMLEDIQIHYEELKIKLYENLNNLKFYVLPLDGFDLSDELYIKMNARGKALTDFENFKADWINWMKSKENKEQTYYLSKINLGEREVPKYLSLASHLDNQWTDIFWPVAIKNEKEEDKIVDKFFLRFIKRYCLNQYIITSKQKPIEIEASKIFNKFYSNADSEKYDSFESYERILSFDTVIQFEKVLNSIYNHQSSIRKIISPKWDNTDEWFLYDNEITQIQRILFLAITEYLSRNEFEENKFRDWIRIVWNFISDPDIRSIPIMIGTMKTIHLLAQGSKDINRFILNDGYLDFYDNLSDIQKLQIDEEKLKVSLLNDKDWNKVIILAEAHPLFQGNIGFIISSIDSASKAKSRYNIAKELFDKNGPKKLFEDKNHILIRFVLSEFKDWSKLKNFNFSDTEINWRTNLRRNEHVKTSVQKLLECNNIDEAKEIMLTTINRDSNIQPEVEIEKTSHFNLYYDNNFHIWMQKNGVNKIKWLGSHNFVVCPRAWYDKVLIDCNRNEIVSNLISTFRIDQLNNHKCDDSGYYRMEQIELNKEIDNLKFSFYLDGYRSLKVGLRTKLNPDIENYNDEEWVEVEEFDYVTMNDAKDIKNFLDLIKKQLSKTNYLQQL